MTDPSARFYIACRDGDVRAVARMLANPYLDVNRDSPFTIACEKNHIAVVELLLQDPRVEVNAGGLRTPFSIVCAKGHLQIVKLLLASPRIEPRASHLNNACENGHTDVVALLLADKRINVRTAFDSFSLIRASVTCAGAGVLRLLLNDPRFYVDDQHLIFMACEYGNLEAVKYLAACPEVDINKPRGGNTTPFHVACEHGRTDIVRFLMRDPRVDVNSVCYDDITPFMVACLSNRFETVRLLLSDSRIDVNSESAEYRTPFLGAVHNDLIDIVALLLTKWNKVDLTRRWAGNTPLQIATKRNLPVIVKLITDFQADPERTTLQLRSFLGLSLAEAAEFFALVVLVSDGYFVVSEASVIIGRFFAIAKRLPMELQMVLCRRAAGLAGDTILVRDVDDAFRAML